MLIASIPFLVLLVGGILWFFPPKASTKPWAEVGKIMFAVGLFFAVWRAAEFVKLW